MFVTGALQKRLCDVQHLYPDSECRHPFPGPGIGVRVIGAIDAERVKIARQADYVGDARV